MTNNYRNQAKLLAERAHKEQLDIGGTDYFSGHLTTVVEIIKKFTNDDYIVSVGWLHDILEDTKVTEQDLLEKFPIEIVEAVCAITKRDSEDYNVYLERVKSNEIARTVKIADLKHNSDLTRLNRTIKSRDTKRAVKYTNAIKYLSDEKRGNF